MYMPYSTNPHLPALRMRAVNQVFCGSSIRKTARYFGVQPSTVSRWVKRDKNRGLRPIPTRSSRPRTHPRSLKPEVVARIVSARKLHNRCGLVVHQELANQGVVVSLSSVQRTLRRQVPARQALSLEKVAFHYSTTGGRKRRRFGAN